MKRVLPFGLVFVLAGCFNFKTAEEEWCRINADAGLCDAGGGATGGGGGEMTGGGTGGGGGVQDAGEDAGSDAGEDAGKDAGIDAGEDAGLDAGEDAGVDAGIDAGIDAGVDAGRPWLRIAGEFDSTYQRVGQIGVSAEGELVLAASVQGVSNFGGPDVDTGASTTPDVVLSRSDRNGVQLSQWVFGGVARDEVVGAGLDHRGNTWTAFNLATNENLGLDGGDFVTGGAFVVPATALVRVSDDGGVAVTRLHANGNVFASEQLRVSPSGTVMIGGTQLVAVNINGVNANMACRVSAGLDSAGGRHAWWVSFAPDGACSFLSAVSCTPSNVDLLDLAIDPNANDDQFGVAVVDSAHACNIGNQSVTATSAGLLVARTGADGGSKGAYFIDHAAGPARVAMSGSNILLFGSLSGPSATLMADAGPDRDIFVVKLSNNTLQPVFSTIQFLKSNGDDFVHQAQRGPDGKMWLVAEYRGDGLRLPGIAFDGGTHTPSRPGFFVARVDPISMLVESAWPLNIEGGATITGMGFGPDGELLLAGSIDGGSRVDFGTGFITAGSQVGKTSVFFGRPDLP